MKETIVHLFLIGFQRAKSRFNAPRVQAGERVPVVKKQMLVSCTMKRDQSGARLLRGTLVLLVFLSNFVSVPSSPGAEPPNLAETRRLAEQGDSVSGHFKMHHLWSLQSAPPLTGVFLGFLGSFWQGVFLFP